MKVSVTELVDVVNQQFQQSLFKNLFCTVENQIHFNINKEGTAIFSTFLLNRC